MPEMTGRQRRFFAHRERMRDYEREANRTSVLMAFDDVQAVADQKWVTAWFSTNGHFHRECLRGWDRQQAIRVQAEAELRCAGCGRLLSDTPRGRAK
jgi:hypothetical protein